MQGKKTAMYLHKMFLLEHMSYGFEYIKNRK